jgi:hypothetical protein
MDVAVTYCKQVRGLIKINGCPIDLIEPEILHYKAFEPILLLGRQPFASGYENQGERRRTHIADIHQFSNVLFDQTSCSGNVKKFFFMQWWLGGAIRRLWQFSCDCNN